MNARDYALHLLDRSKLPGWSTNIIHKPETPQDTRDIALGETISIGIVKNLLLLKHLIRHYAGRKLQSIDPSVQKILCVGLYQLRFMPRIRPAAVVDEAVEQAKRLKLGRAGGFINAVLRKATREPDVVIPLPDNLEQFVTVTLSHPIELWTKLVEIMGPDEALALCQRNNTEPPTIVRLGAEKTIRHLRREGLTPTAHRKLGFAVVEGAVRADFAKWAVEKTAQVQDPTSGEVVEFLDIFPGITVLDRCCGLGTKTLQMADLVGEEGLVVATDPAKFRIKTLNQSLTSRAIKHVQTHAVGMLDQIEIKKPFDRILLDVPCSNSGVIIRRPEARFHQDDKSIKKLIELQRRIILDTLPHLRPGGQMVYSTCSIWREENGDQIHWLLQQDPRYEIHKLQTTLPSTTEDPTAHHDGGFIAVLGRRE